MMESMKQNPLVKELEVEGRKRNCTMLKGMNYLLQMQKLTKSNQNNLDVCKENIETKMVCLMAMVGFTIFEIRWIKVLVICIMNNKLIWDQRRRRKRREVLEQEMMISGTLYRRITLTTKKVVVVTMVGVCLHLIMEVTLMLRK